MIVRASKQPGVLDVVALIFASAPHKQRTCNSFDIGHGQAPSTRASLDFVEAALRLSNN
jgi:hypothetical protein